jgi:hypothetical protein
VKKNSLVARDPDSLAVRGDPGGVEVGPTISVDRYPWETVDLVGNDRVLPEGEREYLGSRMRQRLGFLK